MQLVNFGGTLAQRGIELAETGINITDFVVKYKPEFKDFMLDRVGEKRGFAQGAVESMISIKGEVTGATGIMSVTFAAAFTPANDIDGFGQTTGAVWADSIDITQGNQGWRSISLEASRNAGITATS